MALKLNKHGGLVLREADVARQILDYLHAEGFYCLRLQSGLFTRPGGKARIRAGEPGLPDYLCLKTGTANGFRLWSYTFFLETKSESGKLRPDQILWQENAARRGFTTCVAYGFNEFRAWFLARFGRPQELQGEINAPVSCHDK